MWTFLLLSSLAWAAYYWLRIAQRPRVFARPGSKVDVWLQRCEALAAYYPTVWCTNGHCQTLLAFLLRRKPKVSYHRELLAMADGGTVALDWTASPAALQSDALREVPTVVILHGVTGGSSESYVSHLAAAAHARGWAAVVFNQRGCGGSRLTSARLYCAASSDDCRDVLAHVRRARPASPLLAVGFSMGANVLVKYMGEAGAECPLQAAVSVANPLDLLRSGRLLKAGLSRWLYSAAILHRLRRYLKKHHDMVSRVMDPTVSKRCITVWDFDDALTAPAFGFSTAEEYYCAAASASRLRSVQVPLLCLNAEDDPIAPADAKYAALASQHVAFVTTPSGGHLAWLEGWWPNGSNWADRLVLQFFDAACPA